MKHLNLFITLFILACPLFQAQAEETCHKLDFDSYFAVQNVQGNIKRLNPDLSHPNFAEHFLFLRAELAMETLYVIASCETGKFFHEKLTADSAAFSLHSNQVDLSTAKGDRSHYEWDGKSWIQGAVVEAPIVSVGANLSPGTNASPTPASSRAQTASASPTPTTPSLTEAYQALFAQHPETETAQGTPCAPIDYTSFFRAQQNKEKIKNTNPDLTHPNFDGNKILVRSESMFDALYLVAECKTGKFSDDYLKGNVTFQPHSRLVLVKSSDAHPQLMLWSENQWIRIPDPVQKKQEAIKNTLYGNKAVLLIANLPNPHHVDTLRFETVPKTDALAPLFQELGVESLKSGECRTRNGHSPVCDVMTE